MPIADRQLTVADYVTSWLTGRTAIRPSTAVSYAAIVDIYIKPGVGPIRLSDLRATDLDQLFAAMWQMAPTSSGVHPRLPTVNAWCIWTAARWKRYAPTAAPRFTACWPPPTTWCSPARDAPAGDTADLAAMERDLCDADGLRVVLQRQAREQLSVEGAPTTRATVTRRAHALLGAQATNTAADTAC